MPGCCPGPCPHGLATHKGHPSWCWDTPHLPSPRFSWLPTSTPQTCALWCGSPCGLPTAHPGTPGVWRGPGGEADLSVGRPFTKDRNWTLWLREVHPPQAPAVPRGPPHRGVLALQAGAVETQGGDSGRAPWGVEETLVATLARLRLRQVPGGQGDGLHHTHRNIDLGGGQDLRAVLGAARLWLSKCNERMYPTAAQTMAPARSLRFSGQVQLDPLYKPH